MGSTHGIRAEDKVKCPFDGFVMELLAVGDGCGYFCEACENTFDEDGKEFRYATIDGEVREVIPCPDGITGCEVLHTKPVSITSLGCLDCDTPIQVANPETMEDPVECPVCESHFMLKPGVGGMMLIACDDESETE